MERYIYRVALWIGFFHAIAMKSGVEAAVFLAAIAICVTVENCALAVLATWGYDHNILTWRKFLQRTQAKVSKAKGSSHIDGWE